MSTLGNLQVIGLLYDAVGIVILGVPAVFRMVQEVQAQSQTRWDYNADTAKALATSRVDISVGSIALLLGFVFQLLSTVGLSVRTEVGIALIAVLIVFASAYLMWLRGKLASLLLNRVIAAHEKGIAEQTRRLEEEGSR
jgi:hypothetical protein